MSNLVLTPVAEVNALYAQGGLAPRRKGQRYRYLYDLTPDFYDQQGQVNKQFQTAPNPIAAVQYLGTFNGHGHYGNVVTYRAFVITLTTGQKVGGYSNNADSYVLCLHTGYLG
jgi:hypothetical protein